MEKKWKGQSCINKAARYVYGDGDDINFTKNKPNAFTRA